MVGNMKQPIVLVRCTKCEAHKPDTEFHKNNNSSNGLCCWCKECTNANSRRIRAELNTYFHPGEVYNKSTHRWDKVNVNF